MGFIHLPLRLWKKSRRIHGVGFCVALRNMSQKIESFASYQTDMGVS
jgi:hypothetical protein